MDLKLDTVVSALVSSAVFTTLGLFFFLVTFFILQKVLPFSIRKEIEEDQNTAVSLIIAALIIGIAMIVSAAVHG